MRNVFVTGATGFIGRHLVKKLLNEQVEIHCLVRAGSDVRHLDHERIQLVYGQVQEPDAYREFLAECDTVLHVAGMRFGATSKILNEVNGNACGMIADASIAAGVSKLVYVSSLAAAGPPENGRPREECDPPLPISNYGRSKRLGETELQKRASDLAITVIRPGIVFGPNDPAMASMFKSIYRFRLHLVIGFLYTPQLSLIHVDDLVNLILQAAEKGERLEDSNGRYIPNGFYFAVDDAQHPSYRELGHVIARSLNRSVFVLPMTQQFGGWMGHTLHAISRFSGKPSILDADKVREAIAPSWASSGTKAREQLGFQVAKPLADRLRETGKWFIDNNWI